VLSITQAVTTSLRRWRDFSGRSRRSEYWWTTLFAIVLTTALTIIDAALISEDYPVGYPLPGFEGFFINIWTDFVIFPLTTICSVLVLIPLLAVGIRRMHDVGQSGWWMIIPTILANFGFYWSEMSSVGSSIYLQEFSIAPGPMFAVGIWMILIVTSVVSFVFCVLDSHKTANRYGPSPKYSDQQMAFD